MENGEPQIGCKNMYQNAQNCIIQFQTIPERRTPVYLGPGSNPREKGKERDRKEKRTNE